MTVIHLAYTRFTYAELTPGTWGNKPGTARLGALCPYKKGDAPKLTTVAAEVTCKHCLKEMPAPVAISKVKAQMNRWRAQAGVAPLA